MNNTGTVYWITGLSGSGKTTVGKKLYDHLKKEKESVIRIDGDEMREIFRNIDYTPEGRKNLGYQYAGLCKLLSEQGMDVVVSVIVMYDEVRNWNRRNIKNYKEIYLEVSMEELIKRNQKGIYTEAMKDKNNKVYGISIDAEFPQAPDLKISNYGETTADDAYKVIVDKLL